MPMRISATPPPDWDGRIVSAALSPGFATAMSSLGWRSLYVSDDSDLALVFIRRLPVPGLGSLTTRAKVYLNEGYPTFVRALREELGHQGVAYAVIGDSSVPLPAHLPAWFPAGVTVMRPRITHDTHRSDDEMLAGMHSRARWALRKSARCGVRVDEITNEADLSDFVSLGKETADRMRRRNLVSALPGDFFRCIMRRMVPRGDAVFFVARAASHTLAGALFLRLGTSLKYYHGVSTRAPELVSQQGPSAIFWHALRYARDRNFSMLDHGIVTVTEDTTHPHYSVYDYKRRFGGRLEEVAAAHLVLSPAKHAFQERIMMPVWKRVYPLYMRWNGRPEETGRVA